MASLTFSDQGWCHGQGAGLRVRRPGLCSHDLTLPDLANSQYPAYMEQAPPFSETKIPH